MQEQIFVHGYFGRNKGILTGFVIFSIMSGTSYMLWSFLFEQASGFAGGTADTSIQQLCLSAGLCLLYFVGQCYSNHQNRLSPFAGGLC